MENAKLDSYMETDTVLVLFNKKLPKRAFMKKHKYAEIIAHPELQEEIEAVGASFTNITSLVDPGSIYDASSFAEELSRLTLPDGSRLVKSFLYHGYELWWTNYGNLFTRFSLPYSQYKRLLEHLASFQAVHLCDAAFKSLMVCYLEAHNISVTVLSDSHRGNFLQRVFPIGIFVQIAITIFSLPFLVLLRRPIMLYIGDKFEPPNDYDFRMKYIYEELRKRKLPFVEFVRSLSPTASVLRHAFKRMRPVVYYEATVYIACLLSILSGGRTAAKRRYGSHSFAFAESPYKKFQYLVATQYLHSVYDDIWTIRINRLIIKMIGVKTAFFAAANERNYPCFIGCKLNNIPTVGIFHGVQTRFYNLYDFTPAYDGVKSLTVDKFGLWSDWWKEYYLKYSKAYKPEQLHISGPMRPVPTRKVAATKQFKTNPEKIKVLLVSETVAVPAEVTPYLDALLADKQISVCIKFRVHFDSFERWLKENRPDILERLAKENIFKGTMYEAIENVDVVVGTQSTGVIEATLNEKPFVFFKTKKWGDYFDMRSHSGRFNFFAENESELIRYIKTSGEIPVTLLSQLSRQFFGDQTKNGSAWVVDRLEENCRK